MSALPAGGNHRNAAFNTRPAMLITPGGRLSPTAVRGRLTRSPCSFCRQATMSLSLYYPAVGRRAPELRWQPLIDAAGAILHIRKNAVQFHIDPARSRSAASRQAAILRRPRQSCGTLSRFGRHSASAEKRLCPMPWCWATRSSPAANSGMTARSATSAVTMPALRGTMSLENQVSDGLPPFYIWHTVEDAAVPVQNSMLLATALTAHKVPFELHLFAHDGHGTSTCTQEVNTPNRHNSAWVPLCTDWLADTLDFHL